MRFPWRDSVSGGEAGAFKLWPVGQREARWQPGRWVHVRIDVAGAIANVFVGDDPQPFATFYDLPFARGGVRLTAYAGFALFRNLRVTALPVGAGQPLLADPWAATRKGGVLRDWQVSPAYAPGASSDGIPDAVAHDAIAWQPAPVDGRGVVNLTGHFQPNHCAATAFARTAVHAEKDGPRRLALTYTDNFRLWCNGEPVFAGPPRNWFHPDREKYGNSRLIPDQFEVNGYSSSPEVPGFETLPTALPHGDDCHARRYYISLQDHRKTRSGRDGCRL